MLNHKTREIDYMNAGLATRSNKGVLLLSQNGIPEELTRLDDYVSIDRKYPGYKRITSITTLAARGLPILKGFVTMTISEEVLEYLKYWMRERRMERLMVLFDSTKTADLTRFAAFSLTLEELKSMGYLLHDTVVAILMEENDQFQQSYSVSTSFCGDHILCEVVGPGFEVNDLTLGHISPHERLLFRRKDRNDDSYRDLGPADLIEHFIIGQEAYRQSVKLRYSKIYNMMCKCPENMIYTSSLTQGQRRDVEMLLEQHSSTLLIHKNRYPSINYEKLRELYRYISELDVFYSDEVKGKVVEASFLKKRGLVFWGSFGSNQVITTQQERYRIVKQA